MEFTALQQRQVRPLIYSSERFNTRAHPIQCCPGQPQGGFGEALAEGACEAQARPYPSAMEAGSESRLQPLCRAKDFVQEMVKQVEMWPFE